MRIIVSSRFFICALLVSAVTIGNAQLRSPERNASKNISKQNWDKAELQLRKSLVKDSLNAASKYLYARFFFNTQNPSFNIDSAYRYVSQALIDYQLAGAKQRDKMRKLQVDSSVCVSLREQIDSAAFQRAKQLNTEGAFLHFLKAFPFAEQRKQATELRDEAAYLDAVRANTYQGFLTFLEKYPSSASAQKAKAAYDKLLFEAKTSDHKLKSYELFLTEHRATPYRRVVEQYIFDIITASGEISAFTSYLDKYPLSSMAGKAWNILFYLLQDLENSEQHDRYLNDSLTSVRKLNTGFLVLILKDGKFGFMDSRGNVIITPDYSMPQPSYKCGGVTDDILEVDHKLIGRNKHLVFADSVSGFEDMGSGFLFVNSLGCGKVVHKSASVFNDCYDNAKVLSQRQLALQKNGKWGVFTFSGIRLVNFDWDEINAFGKILTFKKDGKFTMCSIDKIAMIADHVDPEFSESYDEIKSWSKSLLLIRKGNALGIINHDLNFIVPMTRGEIRKSFFGSVLKSDSSTEIFDQDFKKLAGCREVMVNEPWLACRDDSAWFLTNLKLMKSQGYDSVAFQGPFAAGFTADSVQIHTASLKIRLPKAATTSFIPGKDSSAFLIVALDKKKTLYNQRGTKLFTSDFDDIQYAGSGYFIATKKEKKGLLSYDGKVVLAAEYDAIGSLSNEVASLLKNGKFGAYHVGLRKLIKPQYEKNLNPYNQKIISAYQKGLYGFIDWENKPIAPFEFDEITFWNDTTALVKKGHNWNLFFITGRKILLDKIRNLKYISDTKDEKLAIVQQENVFGVLSNRRDFVIPATFSRLSNVGTVDEPVYLTEKHVEEASIFVAIYYDQNGKMLFRQVYEEDDYDRIYCSDN
jgi:hypothetical protein